MEAQFCTIDFLTKISLARRSNFCEKRRLGSSLRCETVAEAKFNAVLVNLYREGRDSVSWHSDNEAINGREPTIASVSLGATRRFDLRHRETKQTVKVDLEDGSLLVMSGLSQQCWVHQIAKTAKPVGPRINLTFRLVQAV